MVRTIAAMASILARFELLHIDAYHPHYLTGDHKGFWNWMLRNAGLAGC